uniref:D-cysteine desulfhydrase family protein n=1 Tax=candidate division WOR-3 bacterium TaxID=2052148 RepID=A0A7C3YT43_UNCW3
MPSSALTPLSLASKPTPIQKIRFGDYEIHIKRDDLTGLITSGNKVRKLEFLLADALNKKAKVIVTCGNIQSNHVRATLYLSNILGLKGVAILNGKKPKFPEGNTFLDYLFTDEIYFLNDEEYEKKEEFAENLISKYRSKGIDAYFIPTGGSNGIGCLGYTEAMIEMVDYIKNQGIDALFCAVGSGGTYAGLLIGRYISGLDIPIYGILVDETKEYFLKKITGIIKEAERVLGRKLEIGENEILLIEGYKGSGYAIPYKEEIEIIWKLARRGILLDPVYTGKAFYGMIKEKERLNYTNPLFIHTGGIFSLFGFKEEILKYRIPQKK